MSHTHSLICVIETKHRQRIMIVCLAIDSAYAILCNSDWSCADQLYVKKRSHTYNWHTEIKNTSTCDHETQIAMAYTWHVHIYMKCNKKTTVINILTNLCQQSTYQHRARFVICETQRQKYKYFVILGMWTLT